MSSESESGSFQKKQISDMSKSRTGKIMGIVGTKRFINKLKGKFIKFNILIGKVKRGGKSKFSSPVNHENKLSLFKQILFKNIKGRQK